MRHKRLFKNVAFAAATTIIAATPLIISSCSFHRHIPVPEEPVLTTINIDLPDEQYVVQQHKLNKTNQSINVQCFDQFDEPFSAEVEFEIKTNNDEQKWIWIDKDKKINYRGELEIGSYDATIWAINKETGVKSDQKTLTVNVIETELLTPDSISIICDDIEPVVYYSSAGNIVLDIEAFKADYPSEFVSKECLWSIDSVLGPETTDLLGNPLFELNETDCDCQILVSQNINASYVSSYQIAISAKSILNNEVCDNITITIDIKDGFYFYDSATKFTYTRENLEQPWALSLLDSQTNLISNVRTEIDNIPVGKIAPNLCSNSGITNMSGIILPETITEIGDYAFANQSVLYGIAIPSVQVIGASAFENCTNLSLLTTFEQPKLVSVGNKAFYNCKYFKLASANCFEMIGDMAFYGTGLETINLGETIYSIGKNAFSYCPSLKNIEIWTINPPDLCGALYSGTTVINAIKVPLSAVENYKNNSKWSIYRDKIVGI